jgi:repressor LexA
MAAVDRPKLTYQQQALLDAIRAHIAGEGLVPTIRELAERMDLASTSSVAQLLGQLITKGYVTRLHNRPRSLKLVDHPG